MNIYNNGNTTLTAGDIERMHQRIAELEREKAELVAKVEILKKIAYNADGARESNSSGNYGDEKEWLRHLYNVVGEHDCTTTPTQCLNKIKAEAVIEAIDAHKNNVMTFDFNTAIRVTDLIQYANKLRSDL